MSNTISGGISFGGIGSGMDMNAIVGQLKKVQEIPVNRLNLTKAENEYRINALEAVLKQMRESNSILKKFNTPGKMLSLNVESSDKSIASATILGNSELTEGSYTLDVKQIAKPSIYTTKATFDSKDTIINNTGKDQTFTYTYKGVTNVVEIPNNTTLDQFVKRINNDSNNPGVKASLVKNGSGYMLQIQGKDTGKDAELSISSTLSSFQSSDKLFTGSDVVINKSGTDSTMTYSFGGKEYSYKVKAGATAQDFVNDFNKDPNQAVKAKLTRVGSDYKITFADKGTDAELNLNVNSDIAALGGKKLTGTDIANNTKEDQNLTYNFMGKEYSVTVKPNQTVNQVIAAINAKSANDHPGLTAKLDNGQIVFERQDAFIKKPASLKPDEQIKVTINKDHEFTVDDGLSVNEYVSKFNDYAKNNNLDMTAEIDPNTKKIVYKKSGTVVTTVTSNSPELEGKNAFQYQTVTETPGFKSEMEGFGKQALISGKDSVVNSSNSAQQFSATVGGQNINFQVKQGATLQEFADEFNKHTNGADVEAKVVNSASGYKLVYQNKKGEEVKLENVNSGNMTGLAPTGADGWNKQEAQDAIFTLNGWSDQEITSETNKLTEVIEGMEITLKSEGKTVLTVASDTSKVKENIHEVVDAINLVKKTILELSKVDDEKETTKPEDGQMSSQLTWQKGSALTGNYGVQLFLTEFNTITSSMGGGFRKKSDVNDIFGDTFTVLSEIGIKTNAKQGDPNFGLLEIDEEELDKALENDPDAVMELLASPLGGTTPSPEFTVASAGLQAKPGNYKVTYDVDATGHATNVKINGVAAQTDPQFPGRWTVADPKNDAAGVAIQFPTSGGMKVGQGYESEIRIRQGKLNEMISFIDRELVQSDVAGVEQGKIPTIISGLRKNIENLENKIATETERIALWERRERLKFSRLEETLTKYNQQMGSIASIASGMMAG